MSIIPEKEERKEERSKVDTMGGLYTPLSRSKRQQYVIIDYLAVYAILNVAFSYS